MGELSMTNRKAREVGRVQLAAIAVVERETGLGKDTLRVWERRYGFPKPLRDAGGERVYPAEQVEKLRVIRRLMDRGLRPGKLVNRSLAELSASFGATRVERGRRARAMPEPIAGYLQLIKARQPADLQQRLAQDLLRLGLQRFVVEVIAPLNLQVGEVWALGELEIFEEHLYSEQAQHVLRQALGGLTRATRDPRLLLTTLPGEQHQLGLLMAQACLAVEGAECLSLGPETPASDIVLAARAHRVDIVGLS
ncbi:MAG: MerR family transcriptional regulator, partial [Betaproteobacteria bacterium]|nr:MerR family transcriptional regulator [Betaproteobacteria bacterium]